MKIIGQKIERLNLAEPIVHQQKVIEPFVQQKSVDLMDHSLLSIPKRKKRISLAKEGPSLPFRSNPAQQSLPLQQKLTSLQRVQNQLEQEIQSINLTLQKMHKRIGTNNGFLIQLGVDYHLATAIKQLASSRPKVITWALSFHKLPNHLPSEPNAERLPAISISNSGALGPTVGRGDPIYGKFVFERRPHPSVHYLDKWQYFSKGASPNYYEQRRRFKTEQKNHQARPQLRPPSLLASYQPQPQKRLEISQASPRQHISRSALNSHSSEVKSIIKQQGHIPQGSVLAIPDIHEFLEKEHRLMSIWTPPPKQPELLGVTSILVRQKEDGRHLCLIKKYWWVEKAISQRFFNCILDWLSSHHGSTGELSLLTSKPHYDRIFAPLGWQLTNWMREDKLRITYKRALP